MPKITDQATIERGLLALVAAGGNGREAERVLQDDGITISYRTLYDWRETHAERYNALRQEALPQLRAEQADAHRLLAQRQLEGSLSAAELVAKRLDNMEDKDLVNAMGKLDIGSGIHTEKALLLDGQPTSIVQRTSEQIYRELEAEGLKVEEIEVEVLSEEDIAA